MPTRQIYPERILTLNMYRAPGETNGPDDVNRRLQDVGLKARVMRQNPTTDEVWILAVEFVSRHGAALGTALAGLFVLWLKQKNGRRIEIQRPGLKVKVATVRELERTLMSLKKYDDLDITVKSAKSQRKRARRKIAGSKRPVPRSDTDQKRST